MAKTAIIFSEAAEARRAIARLIKPSELFAEVCFSSTPKEVAALLQNRQIDMFFCDLPPARHGSLQLTEELARLTDSRRVPIVYCSPLGTEELRQLGIIPVDSHCLSYRTPTTTVSRRLKQLLQSNPSRLAQKTALGNLIDKSSGVYNRFYFDSFLEHEISRTKLTGRPFSLLLIEPSLPPAPVDISWNRLLPTIASTIKQQIRSSDLLCRVDQNRFALLLPETSSHHAELVVSRIRHRLQESTAENLLKINFGMASSSHNDSVNRQGLLRAAEESL